MLISSSSVIFWSANCLLMWALRFSILLNETSIKFGISLVMIPFSSSMIICVSISSHLMVLLNNDWNDLLIVGLKYFSPSLILKKISGKVVKSISFFEMKPSGLIVFKTLFKIRCSLWELPSLYQIKFSPFHKVVN